MDSTQCSNCGRKLYIAPGDTFVICPTCGTRMNRVVVGYTATTVTEEEKIYKQAISLMDKRTPESLKEAADLFASISYYRDSAEQVSKCIKRANYTRQRIRDERKKRIRNILVLGIIAAIIAIIVLIFKQIIPNSDYKDAKNKMMTGYYEEAITIFEELDGFKDSAYKIKECHYQLAINHLDKGETEKAAIRFGAAGDYADAKSRGESLWSRITIRETISAGSDFTLGVTTYGGVLATGNNDYGQLYVDSWSNIIAVSAGKNHSVGLRKDGTVIATGRNDYGQCNVHSWTDIVAIAAGSTHTLGLKSDGTVVAAGSNSYGQCDVSDWEFVYMIAASYETSFAVSAKSQSVIVDRQTLYETGIAYIGSTNGSHITYLAAGESYVAALEADGSIKTASQNSGWHLGTASSCVSVSVGNTHLSAVTTNGQVISSGADPYLINTEDWSQIVAVAAGDLFTVGLCSDGTVVAAGNNSYGQCNVSDWYNIKLPTKE